MDITFYYNQSDSNYIVKNIVQIESLSGTLRAESSALQPKITVATLNPTAYNYAYIPDFNRYYYVTDWISVRNGVWECSLSVDPLMSYASQIASAKISLVNTQSQDADNYLSSNIFRTTVKEKTDILSFSSGLLENGEYILITAGG